MTGTGNDSGNEVDDDVTTCIYEDDDEGDDVRMRTVLENLARTRVKRFTERFLKGFGSGYGIFAAFKVFTALRRNALGASYPKILEELTSKNSFRFAAFLGLYPSIYELTVELLELSRRKRDGLNSALAGGIAGVAIFVEDSARRRMYCLFAIARALGVICTTMVKRGIIPSIPYSETALFGFCGTIVGYCVGHRPQYLLTEYYRSVLKASRGYTDERLARVFRLPGDRFLTCGEVGLHKDSCTYHAMQNFLQSLPSIAKLYLSVHLAPVLLFKYKKLFEKPKRTLQALLKNIFWSTAFLATMATLSKYISCLLRNYQHKPPPVSTWIPALAGTIGALSVLFEETSRRQELLLFSIPHTLNAIYHLTNEWGFIRHVPYSSVALYALAMVPIMHSYECEPESLSLLVHSALKFFVGKRNSPANTEVGSTSVQRQTDVITSA